MLWRLTRELEKRHGAFFISRLILMTGIKLRGYGATSPDDPLIISRLTAALRQLLSNEDFDGIQPTLRDRT